ncbi:MAG TPA: hypothetical protein VNZ64_22210 [Candidatus Acidoferrum sp.]|nr:hypothetical protein [Candidatus Acidoferrum sp.]
MKRNLAVQPGYLLLLGFSLLFTAVILARMSFSALTTRQTNNANNNPQDFFVRAMPSSLSYSFRYDPRAADEWLFHRGAGLISISVPPGKAQGSTN